MKALPEAERAAATGFFTTIRRTPDGHARGRALQRRVPGRARAGGGAPARGRGRDDAADAARPSSRRARRRSSRNDYYASDVAWMELDASLEPTIGPYETYDDGWFGYKAAFEAFITVRDEQETAKLAPLLRRSCSGSRTACRSTRRCATRSSARMAPIRVVDVVFSSGQGNSGVQTAAYNLPNDERVVAEKGSKRVMLKNTQRGEVRPACSCPSRRWPSPRPTSRTWTSRPSSPTSSCTSSCTASARSNITVGGRETTVRLELKDTYGAIEEAKADISGLWALQQLVDKGVLDRSLRADDVHDLPRLGLPLDPLRHRRGPRQGPGPPAQPPPRRGRVQGGPRRHVRGRSREGEAGGHRPHRASS